MSLFRVEPSGSFDYSERYLPPTNIDTITRAECEKRIGGLNRRVRTLTVSLVAVLTIAILLPMASPAIAQGYGVTLSGLLTRVMALETRTASMSTLTDPNTGQPTVRFSGVNLQLVSGSGEYNYATNGRGNILIGYNERRGADDDRSGSHNLVVGIIKCRLLVPTVCQ